MFQIVYPQKTKIRLIHHVKTYRGETWLMMTERPGCSGGQVTEGGTTKAPGALRGTNGGVQLVPLVHLGVCIYSDIQSPLRASAEFAHKYLPDILAHFM